MDKWMASFSLLIPLLYVLLCPRLTFSNFPYSPPLLGFACKDTKRGALRNVRQRPLKA